MKPEKNIYTPVPPQRLYPQEKPNSENNQRIYQSGTDNSKGEKEKSSPPEKGKQ
ncbi:hypothetical protein RCC89_13320 [Cytophagaceae bacterium ABcell3]|nr:hypothetical protein RCC89_13320 [Cytophagaceae bacterium ABcell3]